MSPLSSPILALLTGEVRAHFGRWLVGILAIAIGVAMGYAVQLINQAALEEFSHSARSLMGNADIEIRGPNGGFDELLYPRMARLPEVATASPVVEANAWLPQHKQVLKLIGIDVFRAAQVTPNLIGRSVPPRTSNLELLDPDAVFLSPATMAGLHLKPGDPLTVQVGLRPVVLRIAGSLPTLGAGLHLGVLDIGAAQSRLDRLGRLQRIDIKLRPGVNADAFARTLARQLPAGVVAGTPQDSMRGIVTLSRAYRVNLNVLALVALFTGAFLVFSAQAVSVLRRRTQLALLRALGMMRSGVLRLILLEGATQGMLGSLFGLALGLGLAAAVLRFAGADLGGGYFEGVRPTVQFDTATALLFFALGLLVSLLGSFVPAWEAAHTYPAPALKAGDEERALQQLRAPWPGLVAIAAGLALTRAGPMANLPLGGYVAIALLLLGTIILMPWLTYAVFHRQPAAQHTLVQLALAQLAGAPGRAMIGLSGILASFSLMAAMVIMVASFRNSVEDWLVAILPAPLYLRAAPAGDAGYFSSEDQHIIKSTPGITHVEFLLSSQLLLDMHRPPVALLARQIDPRMPMARLPLVEAPLLPRPGDPPPIWVSEAMVDLYGFKPGQRVQLPVAGRPFLFMVAGVWRDYVRQFGAVVITQDDYRRLSGDLRVTDAALWPAPGTDQIRLQDHLRRRLAGGEHVQFAQAGMIFAASLRIFDRSFAVTYLLEAVAVLVGVFGVSTSFSAQALARVREFGVLRHLGMTRRQIGAMLALEGGLLALLGISVGLVLGWGIALILIHVVNPQSFHWTMQLHMPWMVLVQLAATLLAAATLTAFFSGRQAMSTSAVNAVREDW